MRMVRLTIDYDMDDTTKPLADELKDWTEGNITVLDLFTMSRDGKDVVWNDDVRVKLTELDSQGEVPQPREWMDK